MDEAGRRLHEVPYDLRVNGRVERGVIDALYLQHGRWTLVEFKTDDVRNREGLSRLLHEEGYASQVQRYAAAVEQLVGQRPRVLLCMLNYAGAVRLVAL
jgi:ATP-dependent exoDNAse (exonuclease V) beta subunit